MRARLGFLGIIALALLGFPSAIQAASVNSLGLTATYNVQARFNWVDRAVSVTSTAHVQNTTSSSVSVVAFNLTPLRLGSARLGAVTVDGAAAAGRASDQTVLVTLPHALSPNKRADITIAYSAHLSTFGGGDRWLFGRMNGVMTAYRWIPWLSRTLPFNRPNDGDPWVTPTSPRVDVTITSDTKLVFATSGRRVSGGGMTQSFTATNVRDFNFSASPNYRTASRSVRGTTITVYYLALPASTILDWTERAFNDYSAKVGGYPFPQYSVAEIGPWSGIESPSMSWVPSNAGAKQLPWIVTHEAAHQWFYSVVGNDQAGEPFADEAVADFMSRNLISKFISSKCAQGNLDQTVYQIGSCYAWVIYVQGNLYLRDYRDYVGSTKFWQGLANYYAANRYRIGGTRKLLNALDAAAGITYPHYKRFPHLYP